MASKPGIPAISSALIRSTTPKPLDPAEDLEPADDQVEETQGRGEAPAPKPKRARVRRQPAEGENRGRKIHLPDSVHDRLKLLAFQRRTTVSAVAADLLDKALPRFRVERES